MSLSASARSCAVAFASSANRPPPLRSADICSCDSEYIRSSEEATFGSVSVDMASTLRRDAVRVPCPLGGLELALDEHHVVLERTARHVECVGRKVGVGIADRYAAQ